MTVCLADADKRRMPEIVASLAALAPSGVAEGRGSACDAAIVNSADLRAGNRVLYATAATRAFVLLGPALGSGAAITADAAILFRPGGPGVAFDCRTPGERLLLALVAGSYGRPLTSLILTSDSPRTQASVASPRRTTVMCRLVQPRHGSSSSSTESTCVYDYSTRGLAELLSVQAPWVRMTGTYIVDVFRAYAGKDGVINLACVEDLLVLRGRPAGGILSQLCDQLMPPAADSQTLARNTFYAAYFPFADAALAALATASSRAAVRFRGVVQFEDFADRSGPPAATGDAASDWTLDERLEGVFDLAWQRRVRRLVVSPPSIRGIPLRAGDRVTLQAQISRARDGDYVVHSVDGGAATLTSPRLVDGPGALSRRRDGAELWSGSGGSGLRAGERVLVTSLGRLGRADGAGGVVLGDSPGAGAPEEAPEEGCVTDPTVPTRQLCLLAGGVWDRPCRLDSECPFFAPTAGGRGGCTDSGFCELPLGVRAVGFRQHDPTSVPLCHGCPDLGSAACCGDDRATSYAFAGDFADRLPRTLA